MPLYSEEVQDIMEKIPGSLLKYGLAIIGGVIFLLLIGTYLFKIPEKIECPISLITINPPLAMHAQTTGKIWKLAVCENDTISKGHLIAILENTADFQDIVLLQNQLSLYSSISSWDSSVVQGKQEQNYQAGEIQENYNQFCKSWNAFHDYLRLNYLPLKMALLNQQIYQQKNEYAELEKQYILQKQHFELTENQYKRDSTFYVKYNVAVSQHEYEKTTQDFISKKMAFMNFCTDMRIVKNEITKLEEGLLDLNIQNEQELAQYRRQLEENFRLLTEQIRQWKEKYILEAPVNGIVSFTKFWKENQLIKQGDRLITIVPLEDSHIIGHAYIDMDGIGKVKKGQKVNIKLHGFPYMEYGMIKGVVINISLVPEEGKSYIAEVELSEGMKSSYRKELEFVQQMEGKAEIITNEGRLLTRLIMPLRALFDN